MTKLIICRCGQQYQLPAHQSVEGMPCQRCGSALSDLSDSIDDNDRQANSNSEIKLLKWVASGVMSILIIALLVLVIIPKLNPPSDQSPTPSPDQPTDQPIAQVDPGDSRIAPPTKSSNSDKVGKDGETNPTPPTPSSSQGNKQTNQPSNQEDAGTGKQPGNASSTGKTTPTPQVVPQPKLPQNELAVYRKARKFAVSADGNVIVTYAIDDPNRTTNVKIELIAWNANTGEKLQTLPRPGITTAMAVSHDGRHVVTTGRGTPGPVALRLWNIETGKLVQSFDVLLPDSWIGFSSDHETAWCFVPKQGLFTIAMKTGKFQHFKGTPITATEATFDHTTGVALLKHNGGRGKQWLDVFPLATKRVSQSVDTGTSTIGSFAMSPVGKTIATGHRDEIKIFAVSTGKEIKSLERTGMRLAPVMLQFSPDARYLLEMPYGADGKRPAVWDIESETRRELNSGDAIQIAACQRGIVVLDEKRQVRLFDFATGKVIAPSATRAGE